MAAASSSCLPAWLRARVEKQPDLGLDEEEKGKRRRKKKKKKKKQAAVEVDQFGWLPDEVVLIIVNKLFHLETLLRFSLAAKRYSSLASQAQSLVLDFCFPAAALFIGRGLFTRSASQKVSALTRRFQQIKRLHLHLPTARPRPPLPLQMDRGIVFSRWVAVFGSDFEQFLSLSAASVNPSWFDIFQTVVRVATEKHVAARRLLGSRCKTVETAVFFDSSSRQGALLMGKPQIAKLRATNHLHPDPSSSLSLDPHWHRHPALAQLHVVGYHLPSLDLPKTGYTLKNVSLVSAIHGGDHHDAREIVELMGGCEDMANGFHKWDVFTEAARLVFDHHGNNKETLYDFRVHR